MGSLDNLGAALARYKVVQDSWVVGDALLFSTQFGSEDEIVYGFVHQQHVSRMLFRTLDMAMVELVVFKHTGEEQGAGGPGVGTAGHWFARMIGMPTE